MKHYGVIRQDREKQGRDIKRTGMFRKEAENTCQCGERLYKGQMVCSNCLQDIANGMSQSR